MLQSVRIFFLYYFPYLELEIIFSGSIQFFFTNQSPFFYKSTFFPSICKQNGKLYYSLQVSHGTIVPALCGLVLRWRLCRVAVECGFIGI